MIKSPSVFGRKNDYFWEGGVWGICLLHIDKYIPTGYPYHSFTYIHYQMISKERVEWFIFSLSFCFMPFFSFPFSLSHFIFFFHHILITSLPFWIIDFIFLLVILIFLLFEVQRRYSGRRDGHIGRLIHPSINRSIN